MFSIISNKSTKYGKKDGKALKSQSRNKGLDWYENSKGSVGKEDSLIWVKFPLLSKNRSKQIISRKAKGLESIKGSFSEEKK